MNKIFICGRLTREPQVTHLQSGKGVARFTIAVNRAYDREKADFIDCEAWEKQGELVAKYLTKGSQCIVEGELRIAVVVVGLPDAKDAAEHPQHTEDDAREHQEQHHAVPVVPCYLSMYADVLHD